MKKILAIAITLCLMVSLVACSASNDVVAKVNDTQITKSEFDKMFALFKRQYEAIYGPDIWTKEAQAGKTHEELVKEIILDNMINDELMYQAATKDGIKVDDKVVDDELKKFKEQLDSQPDVKKFFTDNNIDDAYLRNQITKSSVIDQYREKLISSIDTSDAGLKKYYDEHIDEFTDEKVKASHILIPIVDENKKPLSKEKQDEAKKTADEVLKKAKAGEDFATLAKTYSQDPGSKDNGGDLGYFGRGVMVPEFEEAAFSLDKGQISDVVKTDYGYHIIKVEDKVNEVRTFDEVKNQIKMQLQQQAYSKELETLKSEAKIEKFEKNIK